MTKSEKKGKGKQNGKNIEYVKAKKHLNKLLKEIESKIKDHNNNEFSKFIDSLCAYENANYVLWKAMNKIKKLIKLIPVIRKTDNT